METDKDETPAIPILYENDYSQLPIGKMVLADGLSETARYVAEHIDQFTFEPAYIKHEDGRVELLEISAVLKPVAAELPGARRTTDLNADI